MRTTAPAPKDHMPNLDKLVVAIVEDDPDIRTALFRLLGSHGHDVFVFGSAEAYLAEACAADCAILDVHLPGISGLDLEGRLRAAGSEMSIVFITADDDAGTREAIRRTRRPSLLKPFDETRLLEALASAAGADR
jgi:FixJ family two-component response regulator